MKCIWDEAQEVDFGQTEKRLHLRVWEDPEGVEKPVYVCEYVAADQWTTEEKAWAAGTLAERLEHGGREQVRLWEMQPEGTIQEVVYEPYTYTARADRGDLPDQEFREAQQAGVAPANPTYTAFQPHTTPVPVEQQREELGQALLSYEQRQELEFARLRGPAYEP